MVTEAAVGVCPLAVEAALDGGVAEDRAQAADPAHHLRADLPGRARAV